jgi:hypothetical protein
LAEIAVGESVQANLVQARLSEAAEAKGRYPCRQQHLIASPDFSLKQFKA